MPSLVSITAHGTTGLSGSLTAVVTPSPAILVGQSAILTIHDINIVGVNSVVQTNCIWVKLLSYSGTVGGGTTDIWYCLSAGASPGATITINFASPTIAGGICGVFDTALSAADQQANNGSAPGSTTATTGTTPTTTQASEVWIGAITVPDGTGVGYTFNTPTNGFALTQANFSTLSNGAVHAGFLYKIVSATGAASTGVTIDSGGAPYGAAIGTFKFVVKSLDDGGGYYYGGQW